MKKTNKLETIGIKDFKSILYAKELEYDKINRTYQIKNCEEFTKNKKLESYFKLEVDQIMFESEGIKIKEVDMKKIQRDCFISLKSILEKQERLIYVYKENDDIIYSPMENHNYFKKEKI
ncbi:hypothetical protein ACV0NZ_001729 [Campylobacter jejuni]